MFLKVNVEEQKMDLKSETVTIMFGRRIEIGFNDLIINLKFHQYLVYLRKYYNIQNQSQNQLNL